MFLQLFCKFEKESWRKRVRERDREIGRQTKADHPYKVNSTDDPGAVQPVDPGADQPVLLSPETAWIILPSL